MKNKKAAFILICLFFVYVVLALFNTLYWTPSYDDSMFVESIGGITDGEMLEVMWIPGQFPGFVFSTIADADLTIPAAVFTFLAGAFIIMKVFKLSFSDLTLRPHKEEK
jgi:hypothetical protein